ncbi:Fungal-specific transcription factor domain-containing protein [Pleurostoma richardsiae]|uniref:Fungal-specific transcription factor domain-containing protein n=1 Tax=Pleurostoma richardsiae TaxID=41990 RepID=A0AA38RLX2_9PEZI|nr:Fungal-specific transcription factor domain-containing protein [Pleurostoma richardsiae]
MENTKSSPEGPLAPSAAPSGAAPDRSAVSSASAGAAPGSHKKHGKRDRVALACQRCKTRKQKCDGNRPACASCARLSLKCVYVVPLVPAAGEKKLYIKALEQRVAELESHLASLGHTGVNEDHLGLGRTPARLQPLPASAAAAQPLLRLEQTASDDEANDILVAVRDLSLSASGHYVGASSNITIGRVLSSVVQNASSQPRREDPDEDDPTPKSATRLHDVIGVPFLSYSVAQRLLQGWFVHVNLRYPALLTPRLLRLHAHRENLNDVYERSILHLVYAVSGRWLESSGEMGHFFSEQHYEAAFEQMDEMLMLRDGRTVDYLILLALYCTRAPRDPGAWTYVGAAMRLCIELGLHRKQRKRPPSVEYEIDKRRFWTVYGLDRDVSISIGRPMSISDHDIDADLPLDIPEENEDDEVCRQAYLHVSNFPRNPPTTMTSFIHRLRLKQIESDIQHEIYRVDRPAQLSDVVIQQYLDRLNAWKDAIPLETRDFKQRPGMPYEGTILYTLHYHRIVRYLLYPMLGQTPMNKQWVRLCADACAGIISDYRALHHVFPVGFAALSIQSVFLAGLTLVYCAWLEPDDFLNIEGPLTDCQILLYIITERYPSARKYRDIFERIKASILSIIQRGDHRPRRPVNLDADVQERVENLGTNWGMGGMGADFSHMMSQMTGTQVGVGVDMSPFTVGSGHASMMDPLPMPPGMPPGHATESLGDNTAAGEQLLWTGMGGVHGIDNMTGLY